MTSKQACGANFDASQTRRSLIGALLAAKARAGREKPILEDHERRTLTYNELILAACVLGSKLSSISRRGERVGLLLPNSVGVVVAFFALHATGRVPAMLNYSAGIQVISAACALASVQTVLTSRKFIEAAKFEEAIAQLSKSYDVVYLEDLRERLTLWDKLLGVIAARFLSLTSRKDNPDDPAAILFTSGAEGAPKAVLLSHANFIANVEQIRRHIALDPKWVFFNPLPIFHSFGLTGGVFLPLFSGMKTIQYPSPLHHKQIPELIRETRANILLGTDTFVGQYGRAAANGDLSSLNFIVCGAERVKDETRRLLLERFNIPIVEGYGATEAAPVIAVNQPENNHVGTVGQFLPGIEYRLEPVTGIESGGRLFVRGPNIMCGYLINQHSVQVPTEGWHDTGDIVSVDQSGFVTIAGRLRRFAKIAGEMVSLNIVENYASRFWPNHEHAAIAIADERRGEQIILLTDLQSADRQEFSAWARENNVPELHLPRKLIFVEKIPLLATGKIDYVAAEKMLDQALKARVNAAN